MVAIGVSTASSAPDALSLSRSGSRGKAGNDDPHGFQDVLDRSGSPRDPGTTPASSPAKAGTGDTDEGSSVPGKASQPPASDVKGSSPAASAGAAPANVAGETQSPVVPAEDIVPPEAMTPEIDPGKLSTADIAEQLAAMVADGSAGQPVADGKAGAAPVKGGKTTPAADGADDDAASSDAKTANGAIADALTLLGGVLPVPAQTAPGVLAAAGQLHGSNVKVMPGSDVGVSAVPVDAADDQPTAAETGMAMLASTSGTLGNASVDAGTSNSDQATKTFSLERVSGKAQIQDLAGARAAADAQQLEIKSTAADSVGTVNVLESRRFVGLADGSNSALVANALTGNKDWAAAMQPSAALTGASATTSASKVMNSLKIQMNPENLGIVTATMRLSGEQLSVDLKVHTAEAYRQLSNDQSAMIDSLRQQGYTVDRVTVTYSSSDTSGNNNQPSAQGQQQQQSGASQGQGSDAQARKQNSGRQAGDQDGVWSTGNLATDDIAAGSAQRARAGGVYL